MWKENYRLGVDKIDRQHMDLFDMTAHLIETVKKPDISMRQKECKDAILFLKKYSLEHFADEEEYQKSIGYAGFTMHRQLHQEFASNVLKHESKMTASNFDMTDVKNFVGMLTAWLAYHVADADQRIVADKYPQKIIIECFHTAICYSLNIMANLSRTDMRTADKDYDFKGDISVSTVVTGDINANVEYIFTNDFALKLLKAFLFIVPESMDTIVYSILLEIINTISKNALLELERSNVYCHLGTPVMKLEPAFASTKESFILSTPIGEIKIGIS